MTVPVPMPSVRADTQKANHLTSALSWRDMVLCLRLVPPEISFRDRNSG